MRERYVGYEKFCAFGTIDYVREWSDLVSGKIFAIITARRCERPAHAVCSEQCHRQIALIGEEVGERCLKIAEPIVTDVDGTTWCYAAQRDTAAGESVRWRVVGDHGVGPPCEHVTDLMLYQGKPSYIGIHGDRKAIWYYDHQPVWHLPTKHLRTFEIVGHRLNVAWDACDACGTPPSLKIDDIRIFLRLPIHEPPKTGPYR